MGGSLCSERGGVITSICTGFLDESWSLVLTLLAEVVVIVVLVVVGVAKYVELVKIGYILLLYLFVLARAVSGCPKYPTDKAVCTWRNDGTYKSRCRWKCDNKTARIDTNRWEIATDIKAHGG